MYETAESNAKSAGETSRARRFNRGIKTIKDLLKQVKSGKPINNEDIPPEVSVNVQKEKRPDQDQQNTVPSQNLNEDSLQESPTRTLPSQPSPTQPSPTQPSPTRPSPTQPSPTRPSPIQPSPTRPTLPIPPAVQPSLPIRPAPTIPVTKPTELPDGKSTLSPDKIETLNLLNARKDEYKRAALVAKKSGNTAVAIGFIKVAKQFENVIKALENGQEVDLSNMPGTPSLDNLSNDNSQDNSQKPQDNGLIKTDSAMEENRMQGNSVNVNELPDGEEVPLIQAGSVLEALQQRLEIYKKQEEAAKEQGNSSKARRMGRIVKQFQDAIKLHNSGKPVPFDELPTPPGYAPIPGTEPPKPETPTVPRTNTEVPSSNSGMVSPKSQIGSPDETGSRGGANSPNTGVPTGQKPDMSRTSG